MDRFRGTVASHRNTPPEDTTMPTRRDFLLVGMAAAMAVAATLGCVAFIESFRGGKELTMNPSDGAGADLVTLPSAHTAQRRRSSA